MRKATLFIIVLLTMSAISVDAQKLLNSPYGRFGIGNLEPVGNFRSLGMGGASIASGNNVNISFLNPATLSAIDTNSFVFDFGMDYTVAKLSDGTSSYTTDDFNFDHLIIAFPIMKRWGVAAGLIPYSNAYYKIAETVEEGDPGYDPVTGSYSNIHEGKGGLSSFFLGTGFSPVKNLSFGANLTVLFGEIERFNHLVFTDDANLFSNRSNEKIVLNGINYDLGVLYSQPLKNNYFVKGGFSFTGSKSYSTEFESLQLRYTSYSGSQYSPDTLSYQSSTGNTTTLPSTMRFGVAFGKTDKFTAAADYIVSNWSSAILPGTAGNLRNSESFHLGLEYVPNKFSNYRFLDRVEYRVGGHTTDNYLIFNDSGIREFGITFGIGLQMRKTMSRTNIYFDMTQRNGSKIPGLYNETYYSVGVSLNLYDRWFLKKKYY